MCYLVKVMAKKKHFPNPLRSTTLQGSTSTKSLPQAPPQGSTSTNSLPQAPPQ
ncbi:hypothetical protein A2U01_0061837, partial [Trifolium medium]|nr:hypothetical protein [Trifolium medium]